MSRHLGKSESPDFVAPVTDWDLECLMSGLVDRAALFARQNRDPQDIHNAQRTFRVWLDSSVEYSSDDWRLFLVWYVFHWQEPSLAIPDKTNLQSIAEQYAKSRPNEISNLEETLIAKAVKSPMDFYEIYRLPELDCAYVKSLLLGYQHSFAFAQLPQSLTTGDIFFGKIIHLDGDRGIIAAHSKAFSPSVKVPIAQIRRHLVRGRKEEFVKNFPLFDADLLNLYYDLLNRELEGL